LITEYVVTSAEVHDSQPVDSLLEKSDEGQTIFADSAYIGESLEQIFKNHLVTPQICKRAYRNKPLSEEDKLENRGNHILERGVNIFLVLWNMSSKQLTSDE
jgi:IS5 family transposase